MFYLLGSEGKKVVIPPFHLTTLAEMVPSIQRYQIIQEDEHHLSVLFTARDEKVAELVYASLKATFEDYLNKNGLLPYVGLTISQTDVIHRDPSGKIRQIFSRVNS